MNAQLQELNVTLEQKVRDKTAELQKSLDDLRQSEEAKRQFVGNITHDLKTPLSVISGHVESLRNRIYEHPDGDSVVERHLRFISSSIHQTDRLLEMLISNALLEAGEEKPLCGLYDFGALVRNYVEQFEDQARRRSIVYRLEIPDERMVVSVDPLWTERILGNLIRNAFKYVGAQDTIRVELGRVGDEVVVEVGDTGCGIPPEKLERIFERKYQVGEADKKTGYGLGLYIVREMVTRLGGAIAVFSDVGKGTTFRITFPLYVDQNALVENSEYTGKERRSEVLERRSGMHRRVRDRVKTEIRDIEHESFMRDVMDTIDRYENKKPESPSILICEDTPGQVHLLVESLHPHYNLFIARDGREGLKKVFEHGERLDLIISDVKMPEMDGYELCRMVFIDERYRHVPFIFLTAYFSPEEQLAGIRLGATDYLQKPFTQSILLEKVNHWISVREHERVLGTIISSLEAKTQEAGKLRGIIEHEIRNPLQMLEGMNFYITQLKAAAETNSLEKIRHYQGKLSNMTKVIDSILDVLDTSRILEEGIDDSCFIEERVEHLLDDGLARTVHYVSDLTFSINNQCSPADRVVCDKKMVTQAFINIIRNASEAVHEKYGKTGTEGTIEVALTRKDNHTVKIDIHDNGVGMSEDIQKKVFQFKHTTKSDGTGIGLYLARRMLQLQGGTIEFDSSENVGSTFSIVLPTK